MTTEEVEAPPPSVSQAKAAFEVLSGVFNDCLTILQAESSSPDHMSGLMGQLKNVSEFFNSTSSSDTRKVGLKDFTGADHEAIDRRLNLIETLVTEYRDKGKNEAVCDAICQAADFIVSRYWWGNSEGTAEIKTYAKKLFGNAASDGHEDNWAGWISEGMRRIRLDLLRHRENLKVA